MKQVEQRVQQLSTGGAVLATNINLAYGNEAEQRESESETQVTNAYQVNMAVLVSSMCHLVCAL